MNFSRSTHWVFAHNLDDLKRQVTKASAQGSMYGSIVNEGEGYYLCHSPNRLTVITPSLLQMLADITNVIVVLLENDQLYMLIKSAGVLVGEYLFDHTEYNSNEFKLAFTALYLIWPRIGEFQLLTNADVDSSADHMTVLNNKVSIPIAVEQCEYKAWLATPFLAWNSKAPSVGLIALVPFKQIPLLKKKASYWQMAAVSTAIVLASIYGFWPTADKPINPPLVSNENVYQGLIDHLTKDGANPLFILSQVAKRLNQLDSLIGWRVGEVEVYQQNGQGFILSVGLASLDGNMSTLMSFGRSQHYVVNVAGERAFLTAKLGFMPTLSSAARFQIGSYERLATARLNAWWDGTSVEFSKDNNKRHSPYVIETVTVKMPQVDGFDLNALGSLFYGDPFAISAIKLTRDVAVAGLFNAEIAMTLAGVMINEKE